MGAYRFLFTGKWIGSFRAVHYFLDNLCLFSWLADEPKRGF